MDLIFSFLSRIEVLIGIFALIVLIIFWLIIRKTQSNKYKKQLNAYEVRYNSIKSVPLPFKLNKAVAIARIDQKAMQTVAQCNADFEMCQNNLRQISQALADTADNIEMGKLKEVKAELLDLESSLVLGEEQVNKLNDFLDNILEKENIQRGEVTGLKEQFRDLKSKAQDNGKSLSYCWHTIELSISDIEKMFSTFEEWMYASDFEKASNLSLDIKESIDNLSEIVNHLPELLDQAREEIPAALERVNAEYEYQLKRGVYVDHLKVDKAVNDINANLKNDLALLKEANALGVKERLDTYQAQLDNLVIALQNEGNSYEELTHVADETADMMEQVIKNIKYVDTQFKNCSVRFGLEDLEDKISEDQMKLAGLQAAKSNIFNRTTGNMVASEQMNALKGLLQEATELNEDILGMKNKLDSAKSDEERAKKQLLKLQLIMNEMQVKIRKNKLPSISSTYENDVQTSFDYIHQMDELINETPMNIEKLNEVSTEAIDFIYKLYNNVNKVVGMAVMVENAIVFGNKYRSSYADIDSELTHAELCYRNGEYTQALTIAIETIEKIHPGSYESLIKESNDNE